MDTDVLGRAPKALRDRVAVMSKTVKRRPETLSRAGPLWTPTQAP